MAAKAEDPKAGIQQVLTKRVCTCDYDAEQGPQVFRAVCFASNSLHIAALLKMQVSATSSIPEAFAAQLSLFCICSSC